MFALRQSNDWSQSCGDLHLPSLNGQGEATLGAHFQAQLDGFSNVGLSFIVRAPLANAAGNGGALDDPYPIFVTDNRYAEFHALHPHSIWRYRATCVSILPVSFFTRRPTFAGHCDGTR